VPLLPVVMAELVIAGALLPTVVVMRNLSSSKRVCIFDHNGEVRGAGCGRRAGDDAGGSIQCNARRKCAAANRPRFRSGSAGCGERLAIGDADISARKRASGDRERGVDCERKIFLTRFCWLNR